MADTAHLLQAESAREIILALLVPTQKQVETLKASEGWAPEAKALLDKSLGLKLMTNGKTLSPIADELWRFLLFSEFAFDLPHGPARSLVQRPQGARCGAAVVEDLCDTLRTAVLEPQRLYRARRERRKRARAARVLLGHSKTLGRRDTFPFEERTFLAGR